MFLRAAELLAGPWRDTLNAATMLGQSKTAHQAEIDAACELIDFLRFNVEFMTRIYAEQPLSSPGVWNRLEYRPLEGFVFAVTPFNFTAIAGNLPTSAALMGNVVLWKPASTAMLSAYYLMRLFQEAGLPDGVINLLLPGSGADDRRRRAREPRPRRRPLHRLDAASSTGCGRRSATNIGRYRNYPRIVGETGGKDFIVAHPSADLDARRGRDRPRRVRVPGPEVLGRLARLRAVEPLAGAARAAGGEVATIKMGDVADFSNFMGAVIDESSFATQRAAIEEAKRSRRRDRGRRRLRRLAGWFVEPTVIETRDPDFRLLRDELFGPVVTTYVYDESRWDETLDLVDANAPYGLTGAVFAEDRAAIREARERLRYAAGNFYVNDKPTGAVVGQQPFGGSRASGTNDKAGSMWNLIRWVTPRTIKETFVPAARLPLPGRPPWGGMAGFFGRAGAPPRRELATAPSPHGGSGAAAPAGGRAPPRRSGRTSTRARSRRDGRGGR